MITVEEFLRPPHGPEELDHVLVSISEDTQTNYEPKNTLENGNNHDPDSTSENSQNQDSDNSSENSQKHDLNSSHYSPLAEFIQGWLEFDVQKISLDPLIAACLSRPCEVRWEPQIPKFARIIYSERQLEALYLQTLITRVNIALEKAIPPEEDRIAIVIGPGAFESVSAEARARRLIPDWIVIRGTFDTSIKTDALPILKELATKRRILAVGDTKLVRQWGRKSNVPYTRACHRDYLRQVQDYCVNLYTRFGFILSNEELVVAQLERAQEPTPRKADQRGLRPRGAPHLEPGLDSQGADFSFSVDYGDGSLRMADNDDPYSLPSLATPLSKSTQVPSKRRHSPTSPETSPAAAANASRRSRYVSNSFSGSDTSNDGSHQITSDPLAPEASSSQDHSKYAESVRDVEVGAIRIRSFDMMLWGEDSFDMMDLEEENKENPYRALFMFVMMIRALVLAGQPLHI